MGVLTSPGQLWDLRRGDADDNRTSPHERGWRTLAVSTALEFNYLTALVAFLSLILLPALLVGLAPPILVTAIGWKFEATALIATRPGAAIVSLALLIGAALWVARPLVAVALDNFWHLHYTLVFPMFVAVREIISATLERFSGDSPDPMSLHRGRRVGTILATLFLASAGLLLAWSVGFSMRAGLDDLRNVNVRSLAGAALKNSAFVLGISMVVASLYWFWGEITTARPVLNWTPEPAPPAAHTLRIAHLSDLHLVGERYGYRMESGTSGPCGNGRVAEALSSLDAMHAARPLDHILVTGDITDAGTRAEWVEFLEILRRCPGLHSRLLFIPGNHDVNIIDRTNPGRFDLPWSVAQALRKLRVLLALDVIQGERVRVVDRASGGPGPSLAEYLRDGERPALLRELAERGSWRGRQEVVKVWDSAFPLIVTPTADGCGVMLLDSNARRHFSLTNAIGVISRDQLRAMRSILRMNRNQSWIILLHHHVVEYPIRSLGLDERIGVALVNAPDVVRAIASHGARVVVLHGHRHRDWIGTRGDAVLCSAPSVTLGDKGSSAPSGGFSLYEVACARDGSMRLATVERVTVA